MVERDSYRIPTTSLDKHIARLALDEAHRLVAAGVSPEVAATAACPGAWSEWRGWVLAVLRGNRTVLRDVASPEEAAAVLRSVYGDGARAEALRRADACSREVDADFWREVADLL